MHNGQEIVPIQFLKTLLPDPASLGERTVGKTNIGCILTALKMVKKRQFTSIMSVTIRNVIRKWEVRQSVILQEYRL